MGAPMAANLARHGHALTVWNRTPDRPGLTLAQAAGAKVANSIAEAVSQAQIIFTCLGDVPDVTAVLLGEGGVLENAPPHSLVVDFSTIGRETAVFLAQQLQARSLRFLDVPVSGGDVGAQQGTLTMMVGGDPTDFAQVLPYLQAMGKNITYCGPVGSGQAVKLCNQVLAALHMVALCEALTLAEAQGLDPQLVVQVCGTGAAGSWALSHLGPKILDGNLEPGFMVQHILKDLRLVQSTIQTQGLNLQGVALAEQRFQQVGDLPHGLGQGTQAMIRTYRENL
ncbi:3-hydroxyisobutyrate dehydrogenase [Synechocystis sp. LKSZ1]